MAYSPTVITPTSKPNTGLIDYNKPQSDKNLTFDGRGIEASPVGANAKQTTPSFATPENVPEFGTSDTYLTDGAFVENRVAGLLEDPNNTLNKRMTANGLADAGTRGLQNTSMGATIGQSVLADNAIRIAQPDAATQATADINRQSAYTQGTLAEQAAKINSKLSEQQSGQAQDLTKLQGSINSDLSTQQAGQLTELTKLQNEAKSALSAQESQQQTDYANLNGEILAASQTRQNDFAVALQKKQFDQQTATEMANIVGTQTNTLINKIFGLLQDPNIEMSANNIKWASDFMYSSWESAANLYNIDIQVV